MMTSAKKGSILFLTCNDNTEPFYDWLVRSGWKVLKWTERLSAIYAESLKPDFAVSFNYSYILPQDVIDALSCPIINVHCSLLPWNRGVSPNYFSYLDNTPKGVTIHELVAGLDKGDILIQKELDLTEAETFRSSYEKLISCAIDLLTSNWESLVSGEIVAHAQVGEGSYHTDADFYSSRDNYPFDWNDRIADWKKRNSIPFMRKNEC